MKSYMRDIERFIMMEKPDSNPHVDTVNMVIRAIEHGKGGKVDVTEYYPFGVTRSRTVKLQCDSYDEVRRLVSDSGTRYNPGDFKAVLASKDAVLRWADRFSHFDIEKMLV